MQEYLHVTYEGLPKSLKLGIPGPEAHHTSARQQDKRGQGYILSSGPHPAILSHLHLCITTSSKSWKVGLVASFGRSMSAFYFDGD